MTEEEIIAVVTAYKEGKTIEFRARHSEIKNDWEENKTSPCGWSFDHYDYRIKPEPHYRPFKSAEELMEAINEHGDWIKYKNGGYYKITYFANEGVQVSDCSVDAYSKAFEEFTFADGTPFGVKED